MNSLELGCDCLGEIRYLDACVHDTRGGAHAIPNAICMHEEDTGILWKHFDWRSGATDVRRARRLVISSIATVGNYEYGLYWYLAHDGAIGVRGQAHRRPAHGRRARGRARRRTRRIAPGVSAGFHQHFFCARLDLDVDGERNVLVEVDSLPDPRRAAQPPRPVRSRPADACSTASRGPAADRLAGVAALARRQPGAPQPHGRAVAYELVPGENVGRWRTRTPSSRAGRAS